MRIRIVHKLTIANIDGIELEQFQPGQSYEVGTTVGALLLAEGWGVPDDDTPTDALDDPPTHNPSHIIRVPHTLAEGIAADRPRRKRKA